MDWTLAGPWPPFRAHNFCVAHLVRPRIFMPVNGKGSYHLCFLEMRSCHSEEVAVAADKESVFVVKNRRSRFLSRSAGSE